MESLDELTEHLKNCQYNNTLILCIGNSLKGDDGAGPALYQKLKGRTATDLIDAGTVPENHIEKIIKKAPANLIIIDTADFGSPPGTIKLLNRHQLQSAAISTHTISPALFLERITSRIDVEIYFIGLQPTQLSLGQGLSTEVNEAIGTLEKLFTKAFGKQ
jgi:hydrogenase 3 maturation protease